MHHAGVGDAAIIQVEFLEASQRFYICKPRVGDAVARSKVKPFQTGQHAQVRQASVRDGRRAKFQNLQLCQSP